MPNLDSNSFVTSTPQVDNRGKKKLTIEEINKFIIDLDKERLNLNLEIDSNDIKIIKYKNSIKTLKQENALKRKRIKNIAERKVYLIKKKKKYEDKDKSNPQLHQSQIIENCTK